jgi:hypothetical protein
MAYEIVDADAARQMDPPPYKIRQPAPGEPIKLQEPAYFPDILPIYPAKMNPYFWAPEGTGENIPNPPDPDPALAVPANVDVPFRPVAGNEPEEIPVSGAQNRVYPKPSAE